MDNVTLIGVDLAKRVFHLHGAAADGSVVFRKKLSRAQFGHFLECHPRCVVAMEACGSAHHWGRLIAGFGHEVRLVPPGYAKQYVKRHKNDTADAEAIAEAASRPTMYNQTGDACIAERAICCGKVSDPAGPSHGISFARHAGPTTHATDQCAEGSFD